MSRLDRHVNAVRNKLAVGTLLKAVAWSLLVFAGVVLLNILVDRFLTYRLPHWVPFFWSALGLSVGVAVAYAIWRRPTPSQAAIAIDQQLGLKEKFSTALYVRASRDPFAAAAVRDAETTAENVSLHQRFPVKVPAMMFATTAMIVLALLAGFLLGPHPLFAQDDTAKKHAAVNQEKQTGDTRKLIDKAISEIESTPTVTAADKATVESARRELTDLKQKPVHDAVVEQRSALKAMQDMQAIKDKVKEIKDKAVEAKNETELFKSIGAPFDEHGPLSDVQKDLAKGDFSSAASDLEKDVNNFDKLKPEDQAKAAKQMEQLTNQLKQIANNQQVQQQVANQLKNLGANSQQLQQLAKAAQQAANGDKQAQQAVQQMAKQIAQQANQQAGLTPQQQQQISQQVQQAVKQMQGNANAQQTAQNMAGAASALAKSMQQAAAQANGKAGGQQQAGQKQGGQQSAGQQASASPGGQQGTGQQPGGQQPGGQQQGAQQPGGQQAGGQQPGGQQGGPGGQSQSVADAGAQMKQQLQDLQDAASQSAEADAQQQQSGDGKEGGENGADGQQANGQQQGNAGQSPWNKGDAGKMGAGSGGPGVSAGGPRPKGVETPVGFKPDIAASQADEKGKLLQVKFVKAMSEKGTSKVEASQIVESAEKDSADEVEQDRISRPAQSVVKRYFDDLKQGQESANPGK